MQSIYQLIATHEKADENFQAVVVQDVPDEELNPVYAHLVESINAILDHRPATLEEARVKAQYLLDLWNAGEDDFGEREMRRLLESLATTDR